MRSVSKIIIASSLTAMTASFAGCSSAKKAVKEEPVEKADTTQVSMPPLDPPVVVPHTWKETMNGDK